MKKITNDDIRDIATRCADRLVLEGYIEDCKDTNKITEFSVQDIIHNEINKALSITEDNVCPKCNQYPYSETENNCPVCFDEII